MGEMTWLEVASAIAQDYNVLLPIGATEQHGLHLPITTDAILPLMVGRAVAERTKTIVATPIYYGMQSKPLSGGGQSFAGTTSLRGVTLIAVVHDVVYELIRQGFKKITLLTWHMENIGFTYEGADLALRDHPSSNARVLSIDNPFASVDQSTITAMFQGDFPGWDIEHAAVIETSLMLAVRPDLVRMDQIVDDEAERHPPYDVLPPTPDMIPSTGVLYRATWGTKEKGDKLFEMLVTGVSDAILTEFGS